MSFFKFKKPKHTGEVLAYGKNVAVRDFFSSPAHAVESLFERESFEGDVWEPASGQGVMSRVIENYNECYSSDIRENCYGEGDLDFLHTDTDFEVDNIITNPPYIYMRDFIEKAKSTATRKIAFLSKLSFLEGKKKYPMWKDTEFPFKCVYVFSKRLNFFVEQEQREVDGSVGYAWYVWDKNYKGAPQIEWIKG